MVSTWWGQLIHLNSYHIVGHFVSFLDPVMLNSYHFLLFLRLVSLLWKFIHEKVRPISQTLKLVHIEVSTPRSKIPPFFAKRSLKSANCPSPLFKQFYILIFCEPPPHKNWTFQWTPIILKFFILNPIPPFKSNSILS